MRNRFDLTGGGKSNYKGEGEMDRASKPRATQSPNGRPFGYVKPVVGVDNFMMNHLKSIARFNPNRERPKEVRL